MGHYLEIGSSAILLKKTCNVSYFLSYVLLGSNLTEWLTTQKQNLEKTLVKQIMKYITNWSRLKYNQDFQVQVSRFNNVDNSWKNREKPWLHDSWKILQAELSLKYKFTFSNETHEKNLVKQIMKHAMKTHEKTWLNEPRNI